MTNCFAVMKHPPHTHTQNNLRETRVYFISPLVLSTMAVRAWGSWSHCMQSDPDRRMHVLRRFRHLIQSRTPAPIMVLPAFWVDLPIPLKPFWKCSPSHSDSKPCQLTMEINRHTCPSHSTYQIQEEWGCSYMRRQTLSAWNPKERVSEVPPM